MTTFWFAVGITVLYLRHFGIYRGLNKIIRDQAREV